MGSGLAHINITYYPMNFVALKNRINIKQTDQCLFNFLCLYYLKILKSINNNQKVIRVKYYSFK
jgi:hypothetical protein